VRGGELSTSVVCRGEKQQPMIYDVNDIDPYRPRTCEPFQGREPLRQRYFSIQSFLSDRPSRAP
jgi:hypothetical protein